MRLREREKRSVGLFALAGVQDDVFIWETGRTIRAAIYPLEQAMQCRFEGEKTTGTHLMLCEDASVEVGMGVCVEAADGRPDFRVISVQTWDHTRAVLSRIPQGRRG